MSANNEIQDAALVDSFFLPGGILDPASYNEDEGNQREEEEAINGAERRPFSFAQPLKNAVPTDNPWAMYPVSNQQTNEPTTLPTPPQGTNKLGLGVEGSLPKRSATKGDVVDGIELLAPLESLENATPVQSPRVDSQAKKAVVPCRPPPGFEQTGQPRMTVEFHPVPMETVHVDRPSQDVNDAESMHSDSSVPRELLHEGEADSCDDSSTSSLSASSSDGEVELEDEDDDEEDEDDEEDDEEDEDDEEEEGGNEIDGSNNAELEERSTNGALPISEDIGNREANITVREVQPENVEAEARKPETSAKESRIKRNKENERIRNNEKFHRPNTRRHRRRIRGDKRNEKALKGDSWPKQENNSAKVPFTNLSATATMLWRSTQSTVTSVFTGLQQLWAWSYLSALPVLRVLRAWFFRISVYLARLVATAVSLLLVMCDSTASEFDNVSTAVVYTFCYSGPTALRILVDQLCLPHWTPYVVSSCVMLSFLSSTNKTTAPVTSAAVANGGASAKAPSQHAGTQWNHGDNMVATCLRAVWLLTIVMQSLFSSNTNDDILGSDTVRSLVAYLVVVHRSGLHKSSVVWLALSFQVILAYEISPSRHVAQFLWTFGLAAINTSKRLLRSK